MVVVFWPKAFQLPIGEHIVSVEEDDNQSFTERSEIEQNPLVREREREREAIGAGFLHGGRRNSLLHGLATPPMLAANWNNIQIEQIVADQGSSDSFTGKVASIQTADSFV